MLKDITIGQYIPGNTVIHRLDPRTKILVMVLFLVAILNTHSLNSYLCAALWTLVMFSLAGVKLRLLWRGLRYFLGLICAMALVGMLLIPGTPWIEWGKLSITYEGLTFGAVAAVRFVLLITGSSLLTYTTSPLRLLDGIAACLKPWRRFGLPAHELAMIMTVALCFLPVVQEEANKIVKAQSARGADFGNGNLLLRTRALVPLFAPLIINAWNRAEELSIVMEARCYHGGEGRTEWRKLSMSPLDYGALALILGLTVGVIWV